MAHIIAFILPQFVAKYGNLWRFSSAKLEARGGRVKRVARAVVSWQPQGVYKKCIKKKRRDGVGTENTRVITVKHTGSGSKQLLDRNARPHPPASLTHRPARMSPVCPLLLFQPTPPPKIYLSPITGSSSMRT